MHSYSVHTQESHPHKYLCAQMSRSTSTYTCTVGVYPRTPAKTHAHSHTKFWSQRGRSQHSTGYCQMVCVMWVITALVFLMDDVALSVCCMYVCLCVYVWAISSAFAFSLSFFLLPSTVELLPKPQAKDLVYQQAYFVLEHARKFIERVHLKRSRSSQLCSRGFCKCPTYFSSVLKVHVCHTGALFKRSGDFLYKFPDHKRRSRHAACDSGLLKPLFSLYFQHLLSQ